MKKIILLLTLLFSLIKVTKAQQEIQLNSGMVSYTGNPVSLTLAYSGPDKDYDFYMRRSKNYRVVGLSTLIGGVVLSGIGLLIANAEYSSNQNSTNMAGVLIVIGAASGIVSIPFMIMASAYKRKAKLMITNQKTGIGIPSNVSKDITGITFQIPIGK